MKPAGRSSGHSEAGGVLLLLHVEADADAVVVLADVAELTGGLVAAEGGKGTQDGEEDL